MTAELSPVFDDIFMVAQSVRQFVFTKNQPALMQHLQTKMDVAKFLVNYVQSRQEFTHRPRIKMPLSKCDVRIFKSEDRSGRKLTKGMNRYMDRETRTISG